MAYGWGRHLRAVGALLGMIGVAGAAQAVQYSVTDLGALGAFGLARVLNDKGQVAGTITTAGDGSQAFLWSNGVMTILPLPGDPGPGRVAHTDVSGINASGAVVGTTVGIGSMGYQGTLWSGGSVTGLGTLPNDNESYADGINDAGVIVGAVGYFGGLEVATYDGAWAKSPVLPGTSYTGYNGRGAINNRGWYVVNVEHVPRPPECGCTAASGAYLFKDGEVINLGLFPGHNFLAVSAINDDGMITGAADVGNLETHAFYYDDGALVDMGGFLGGYSSAAGINNLGQIVGAGGNSASHPSAVAFLWEQGVYTNLNDLIAPDSGWTLTGAYDINNVGQIVGAGMIDGERRAFLLTPLSDVPEPASWALMLLGFGAVGMAMRRQGAVRVAFG
ncbi:PEPxxWA-CTERM sorting domain-containing protein [Sphingomonas sp. AP4-R1]|uniref:PEPxxWA-CTERM sorting domain-containing protein n=1 Tax=Sphingomonas sp. AP4-R1 TaxID=2735134 RepID=UPI001493D8FA|nr:PEPxxWA-CTERM sorting domain-containing protein [Sphingomonas sp. AP4-R1]QJU58718.1 PEPxxWA-CTERM sorting domain-containing protein [Sphingomonas sp. AP4-R1]